MNTTVDKHNYFLETYVEQDSLFAPYIWAKFIATTYNCESFHAKSNASFGATHPEIFV